MWPRRHDGIRCLSVLSDSNRQIVFVSLSFPCLALAAGFHETAAVSLLTRSHKINVHPFTWGEKVTAGRSGEDTVGRQDDEQRMTD